MANLLSIARTAPTLVGLIGPAGAGKSTLAAEITRRHPGRAVVLSLDALRAALSPHGDESDQSVTPQAVARLHARLDSALAADAVVLIDATNAVAAHRYALLDIAGRHQAHTIAIVVLPRLQTVLARNATRSSQAGPCGWTRRVPDETVTAMHRAIAEDLPCLHAEGWHEVHRYDTGPEARP